MHLISACSKALEGLSAELRAGAGAAKSHTWGTWHGAAWEMFRVGLRVSADSYSSF